MDPSVSTLKSELIPKHHAGPLHTAAENLFDSVIEYCWIEAQIRARRREAIAAGGTIDAATQASPPRTEEIRRG